MSVSKRFFTSIIPLALVFMITGCKNTTPDYDTAEKFEAALNEGVDCSNKIVSVIVKDLAPNSAFGYNVMAGKHLNFVDSHNPNVKIGDTFTVKTKEIQSIFGSWIISYNLI